MTLTVAGALITSSSNLEAVTVTLSGKPICRVASTVAVVPAATYIPLKGAVVKACAFTLTV